MVQVGEVREAEEMRCCSLMSHSRAGFKCKCSFGCMHQAFTRCLVVVQKSFGSTLTNFSGAPEALVSYFKWLGGQPDGKQDSGLMVNMSDPSLVGTIKANVRPQKLHEMQSARFWRQRTTAGKIG